MLIVIDPVARRVDGESVRIARDVLCAGADDARVCLLEPDRPGSMARALARRGERRVVVVGDDRALLWAVRLLHGRGELDERPLGVVPVGPAPTVAVARSLGVPPDPVRASRAVLHGPTRPVDALEDDAGELVLGVLGIPAPAPRTVPPPRSWWRPARRPELPSPPAQRLRVEADGKVLADLDHPVRQVSLSAEDGLAAVVVRPGSGAPAVVARAKRVTVSGPGFSYRADAGDRGPERVRTWRARPGAMRLSLPAVRAGRV
ncbi:diacylglycerol kinase family protein [Streptomyces alkaliphilus]|uniref:diacylglycerol kinase family protein n=1 Tax=Streptomyces alkaliphilus TaxID=1472722 RepID=UPI002B2095FD|nr:diacylglycerol kinase family protein [Streptomyces alkaliphilus]